MGCFVGAQRWHQCLCISTSDSSGKRRGGSHCTHLSWFLVLQIGRVRPQFGEVDGEVYHGLVRPDGPSVNVPLGEVQELQPPAYNVRSHHHDDSGRRERHREVPSRQASEDEGPEVVKPEVA